jgi:serine/threonine-protein kinase
MEIDPQVPELLLRWQELRQQGRDPTATELCASCPELAGELQRHIETVDYWEQFLGSRDEAEAANAAPASFGKYQVERILGAGGQASTLLALDPDLHCHVVLKLYHRARTPADQERVLHEGQALERVRSPYVARCRGVERQDSVPALVMEYIPGRDLKEQQRARPLGIDQALELTGQLAEGLAAVHACGLLHRDLKPDNVLVDDDGRPRLVDFGLAAPVASADLARISGTLPYMAPEQARGQAERIDPRTDVYGVGAVLYELLTGRPPHQGASREELWRAACVGDVVPARQLQARVPRSVSDLCMRCLARDPAQRFASAVELVGAVRRLQRWRR